MRRGARLSPQNTAELQPSCFLPKVAEAHTLLQPGVKDGETKVVKEANGGVNAYAWDGKVRGSCGTVSPPPHCYHVIIRSCEARGFCISMFLETLVFAWGPLPLLVFPQPFACMSTEPQVGADRGGCGPSSRRVDGGGAKGAERSTVTPTHSQYLSDLMSPPPDPHAAPPSSTTGSTGTLSLTWTRKRVPPPASWPATGVRTRISSPTDFWSRRGFPLPTGNRCRVMRALRGEGYK